MSHDYPIIDAHAHLWLRQQAVVEGKEIYSMRNGQSMFMGEVRQMMPPYMTDGSNTAEVFLANMDYAGVWGAVITQEYIDGMQNDYLKQVQLRFPERFVCCGMVDAREPGFLEHGRVLAGEGFRGIKIPAQRLITADGRVSLTGNEMMSLFKLMECEDLFLSIDLADGDMQTDEMKEVISECPGLRIAIGHFGMVTRPNWQEQIKLARNANVRIESGGITWLFHDEFYPYKGASRAILEAEELVGADKLMWGSDYPRTMTAITYKMSYEFLFRNGLLDEEFLKAFLGGNAIDFYRFETPDILPYIPNMVE